MFHGNIFPAQQSPEKIIKRALIILGLVCRAKGLFWPFFWSVTQLFDHTTYVIFFYGTFSAYVLASEVSLQRHTK